MVRNRQLLDTARTELAIGLQRSDKINPKNKIKCPAVRISGARWLEMCFALIGLQRFMRLGLWVVLGSCPSVTGGACRIILR